MFHFSFPTGVEKIENEVFTKPGMASRLDMDSSALQDPHGTDDASSNPDNEINNESSDASEELNNQVLVDKNVCSKSHSDDRLSDSVSDKCVSPSSTSHGVLETNNKIVTASPGNDELHPSPKCQNDTSMSSPPLDAPDCHENPASGSETACSDPDSAKSLVEHVSDRKCHLHADMNCDSSEHDANPVLDSQVGDNALSSKEVDMNDAYDEVLEAGPSVNLFQEKITKENNGDVDVSGSVLNHAGESFLHVRSDLNDEIACDGENHLDKEVVSHEMHLDETGLSASGDRSETDPE